MGKSEKIDINTLLDQSIDESLLLLGKALLGRTAVSPSRDSLLHLARKWMNDQREALATIVCVNVRVREIATSKNTGSRRVEIVAAIADAIVGATLGLPVILISLLIVKEGLHSLCASHWK